MRKEAFDDLQKERKARVEQMAFEGDYEARIDDAQKAGFIEGAKVRRSLRPDSEIGEVIGFANRDRAMVITVKFGEDEFPYAIEDLKLAKD